MMRRNCFLFATSASQLLSQNYAHHPDIPSFVWESAIKNGATVPEVDGLRLIGKYTENVAQAYTVDALKVIKQVGAQWLAGELGKSNSQLHERDLKNYEEQRSNILAGKPAFETDPKIKLETKKSTHAYPDSLTKPDVVTFAPTWKSHFQIHARNVSADGRCAVGSDSEDAAVNTLERSATSTLNDKASNNGTLHSERKGKSDLTLNSDAGAIYKRLPAMHEISFVNLQHANAASGEKEWHNLPAWLVEMVLYVHHNSQPEAGGASRRPMAFYNPKVVSLDHWNTYRAVQDSILTQYNAHGFVYNKPQVENPSMLNDLVALYSDKTVIDVNQGFLDYIEQFLRRTGLSMSQFEKLSEAEQKKFCAQYPEDRSKLGDTNFMKQYYAYFRQVATKVGKESEGGMDTRTPSRDPALFKKQQVMVEEGKQHHAWVLGTRREWAGHPGIAKSCERPFAQLRHIREFFADKVLGSSDSHLLPTPVGPDHSCHLGPDLVGAGELQTALREKLDFQNGDSSAFAAFLSEKGITVPEEVRADLDAVLNWKVAKAELIENPSASIKFISSENHDAPVSSEELSDYAPKSPPTLLNLRQEIETFVRYVAAGLGSDQEGCISLRGLSSPDLNEERFEDKATAQIGLSSIRRLVQLETPLLPMGDGANVPCTLELCVSAIDEIGRDIISALDSTTSGTSAQDVDDAAMMLKIWVTRDDVRVDLDALTHMFRCCEGLPESDQLKAQCRGLLGDIYKGKLSAAELSEMGIHQDFGTLSPKAMNRQ